MSYSQLYTTNFLCVADCACCNVLLVAVMLLVLVLLLVQLAVVKCPFSTITSANAASTAVRVDSAN
jgi:hypothetical protein